MINIYLVRHAQSTGNIEKRLTGMQNYELTKEGKIQVEKLTKQLDSIQFEAVYSSPSIRVIDTVKKLAKKNNLQVQILQELGEMYFGIYDGYKWEDVNKINPSISAMHRKTNEIMGIPEQETSEQVADRMYEIIEKIARENKDNTNILIGSHGVSIEAFLRKVTKVPFIEQIQEYSQKNTCVNIIEYMANINSFNLKTLNSTKHLELNLEEE